MNTQNRIVTYEWYGKLYTSQLVLWELFREGKIICERTVRNQYGDDLLFKTLSGEKIASFYSDNTNGFSSQATGIELMFAIPYIS